MFKNKFQKVADYFFGTGHSWNAITDLTAGKFITFTYTTGTDSVTKKEFTFRTGDGFIQAILEKMEEDRGTVKKLQEEIEALKKLL